MGTLVLIGKQTSKAAGQATWPPYQRPAKAVGHMAAVLSIFTIPISMLRFSRAGALTGSAMAMSLFQFKIYH